MASLGPLALPRSGARPKLTPPARTLQRGSPVQQKPGCQRQEESEPPASLQTNRCLVNWGRRSSSARAPGRVTWSPGSASVTCLQATPGHMDVTAHKTDPGPLVHVHRLLMGQDSHFVQPRGRETLQQPVLFTSVTLGVEYDVSCVPCPYLFLPHGLCPTEWTSAFQQWPGCLPLRALLRRR